MPTLLLADDSSTVGRDVAQAFVQEDVRVEAVVSGERAIAQLEADPPDLVLADIGMARVNGYDIASYIKRTPALAHIPVLLLTGPFERLDEQRARGTGCDGVLVKPLLPKALVDVVRAVLSGKRPAELWPSNLPQIEWAVHQVPPPDVATVLPEPSTRSFDWLAWRAAQPAATPTREPLEMAIDHLDEAFARADGTVTSVEDDEAAGFARELRELKELPRALAPLARPAVAPVPLVMSPVPVSEPVTPPAQPILKIKVKIGGSEFQAEGPADVVQAQLEDFKRLAGMGSPSAVNTVTGRNPGLSVVAPRRRNSGPRKTDA